MSECIMAPSVGDFQRKFEWKKEFETGFGNSEKFFLGNSEIWRSAHGRMEFIIVSNHKEKSNGKQRNQQGSRVFENPYNSP